MKNSKRAALLLLLVGIFCAAAFAQGSQAATGAFDKWKAGITAKGTKDISFQGVAIAVVPRGGSQLTVSLSVGASKDVKRFAALTYSVQEVLVTATGIEEVGKSATLVSPVIERSVEDTGDIVSTPQITVADTGRGNAIRVIIKGLDSETGGTMSITVPIGTEIKTAILGRVR
jgi:hypothetical protein